MRDRPYREAQVETILDEQEEDLVCNLMPSLPCHSP